MAKLDKVEALAGPVAFGQTIAAAADSLGMPRNTAYRYSRLPEFQQKVAELRSEATNQAVGQLVHAATQAVSTLQEMLDSDFEPQIRLQASKAILASLGPLSELSELRRRLDQLEKAKAESV